MADQSLLFRWGSFIAAAAHLVGGAALMLRPQWASTGEPVSLLAGGALGALVFGFGVGYTVSAAAPLRHWALHSAGLPAYLAIAAAALVEGVWILAAPAVALAALSASILLRASADFIRETDSEPLQPKERVMLQARTQDGYSLLELSQLRPTLVVFLRHAGCTFCREAVADLARLRPEIERSGTGIVFVTMSPEQEAASFFARYGMADAPRISDPQCRIYRAFELRRGGWRDLFGWPAWKRGFQAGVVAGHGIGMPHGDGFRMPGVFLIHEGRVLRSFRHDGPADRPDYLLLADARSLVAPAHAA
jgi:hypothetical protein